MTPDRLEALRRKVAADREAGLGRVLREADPAEGHAVRLSGARLLDFASNDYLGLARHPEVIAGARDAAAEWGAGAGASRLITGTLRLHGELERRLAAFKETDSALVFSSGYLANLGVIQAVLTACAPEAPPVFIDRLAHACIVDAVRARGVRWRTFAHNDTESLARLLAKSPRAGTSPAALVVTEGVFSMDGDIAPLRALADLCDRHGALLIVDDAHGTGTVGPGGRGAVSSAGLTGHPALIQTGTLSKALGAQGGFVCGTRVVTDLLVQVCRTFLFETALAPACAGGALSALGVLEREPERVAAVQARGERLRARLREAGLAPLGAGTPIVPVVLGAPEAALEARAHLERAGYAAAGIRPPTVPHGTSRLRMTVSAAHTEADIDGLAAAVAAACAAAAPRA